MDRNTVCDDDRAGLVAKLKELSEVQIALISTVVEELLVANDTELVSAYTAWRKDARISSLVELASRIADDDLDQLLFMAEDYFSDAVLTRVAGD